jgi:hypothetical protein
MKSVEIENVEPPLACGPVHTQHTRGPVPTGFHDKGSRGG